MRPANQPLTNPPCIPDSAMALLYILQKRGNKDFWDTLLRVRIFEDEKWPEIPKFPQIKENFAKHSPLKAFFDGKFSISGGYF